MAGEALKDSFPSTRKSPAPLIFLVAACCLVGVYCIFTTDLVGQDLQFFPLLLSGLLLGFIALFEIRVGLAVLLLAIGLSPELEILNIPNFRYEDIIFPILFIVWLTRHTLARKPFVTTDLKMPIVIIVFLSLLTTLNNKIYNDLDMQTAMLRFGKSVEYYFIFVIVLNSLTSMRDVKAFSALMIISSAFVGLYGLAQYNLLGQTEGFRVSGPPGETANILGGYYVFHMCLATGLLMKSKPGTRFLLIGYLALMALPFLQTLSRTSYVALLVGLATIWLLGKNRAIGGVLVLLGLVVILSPNNVAERFWSIFGIVEGDAPSSWESRVEGWKLLLAYAVNAPVLGSGVGNLPLGAVDNEYMLQLHELGIFGLLAFLWLIGRCLKTSYSLYADEQAHDRAGSGFCLGYLGGCIGLLVHSIGATTFTTIRTTEPFFFATGVLYVYYHQMRLEARRRENLADDDEPLLIGRSMPAFRPQPLGRAAPGC